MGFSPYQDVATANVINEFSLNVNVCESYKKQCSVAIAEELYRV